MLKWTSAHAAIALITISLSAPPPNAAAQQPQAARAEQDSARGEGRALLPGDVIRLGGTREAEFRGDYPVDETGTVVLPLLGSRSVAGVPADQLKRNLISDFRQQLRNQDVQIALLRRVRVLGAVKNPGIYFLDPTMTLGDAIALAGGATDQGQTGKVQLVRAGQVIRSGSKVNTSSGEINSGDEIVVPERSWFSRNGKFVIGGLITGVAIVTAAAIR
jgi:protein involved in polysaccharide export with SLBB domain